MKRNKLFLAVLLIAIANQSFAKELNIAEKTVVKPTCNPAGVPQCPAGLKPSCPKKYKPACVFIGTSYLPGCLADGQSNGTFNYHLDKIICDKP